MIDITIEDFVILEDDEKGEITFAIDYEELNDVKENIDGMVLFSTPRFSKNNTFLLINDLTGDEIRFVDVPSRILTKMTELDCIFIVGLKDEKDVAYYLKITK